MGGGGGGFFLRCFRNFLKVTIFHMVLCHKPRDVPVLLVLLSKAALMKICFGPLFLNFLDPLLIISVSKFKWRLL